MTTAISTECPEFPSSRELALFLSRYSSRLFGAGATCIRLEKNIGRIAKAYNRKVEMTIMSRHIHISVWEKGSAEVVTSIAAVNHNCISFNLNTLLSQLSWEIADKRIGFKKANERFEEIIRSDSQPKWLVPILVAFANAAFCRLFGGDWMAMGIVALATYAGYCLKLWLLDKKVDVRIMMILCAFVSSILGATDMLFSLGSTPAVAIATSVLYLVPGIPFINSFSDMLYRHYLCALSRFSEAMVMTACLSLGLCCGMFMMNIGMFE